MERKISFIKLHEGLFVPGPGNLGDTFPISAGGGKTIDELDMSCNPIGVTIKGVRKNVSYSNAQAFEVFVPWTMVKQCVLVPETAKKSDK